MQTTECKIQILCLAAIGCPAEAGSPLRFDWLLAKKTQRHRGKKLKAKSQKLKAKSGQADGRTG